MSSTLNLQHCVIAIAGQPNTGKSTVFNLLTGLKQSVGNWAGKTVEKISGYAPNTEGGYTIIDLPGTYSLNAHSEEERIAASFITDSNPDLVVIVANAASPERTLYYALDCMLLGRPCIIVPNMGDVAELNGKKTDIQKLEKEFGIPVIPFIATKSYNVAVLSSYIKQRLKQPIGMHDITHKLEKLLNPETKKLFNDLVTHLATEKSPASTNKDTLLEQKARCIAWQALENNSEATKNIKAISTYVSSTDTVFEDMQSARYAWLDQATGKTLETSAKTISRTRRWDKWLLHPFWGSLTMVFIALISVVMGIGVGLSIGMLMVYQIKPLEIILLSLMPADFQVLPLMIQGVFRGLSTVLTMLPFIFIFYSIFALLEDVGYMSRAAFLMDRCMRKMGLNGKAFMPILFSLPCNISGVMACRTIENQRTRMLLFLLIPLIPCTAKFFVLFTLAAWLFSALYGSLIVLAVCILNFIVMLVICKLFGIFTAEENDMGMIMELPYYHRPNIRVISHNVMTNCVGFLKKVANLIVSFSILIWFLSYYPTGNIETSWLGQFGQFFEPLGQLMGLDWRMLTALFSSILSKEATIATLGIIYNATPLELPAIMKNVLTPAAAIAFMCAQNLFLPCIATIGILFKESRSNLLSFGILAYTLIIPFIIAPLIYRLCLLFL